MKKVREYISDEFFCLTYGDGVANVHIGELAASHETHGRLATVAVVRSRARLSVFDIELNVVHGSHEKPLGADANYPEYAP